MAQIPAALRGCNVYRGLLVRLGALLFCLTLVGAVQTSASDAPTAGDTATFGLPGDTTPQDAASSAGHPHARWGRHDSDDEHDSDQHDSDQHDTDNDNEHDSDNDNRICLCHAPPGNPGNAHTICVDPDAVCIHLIHGDTLGECAAPCGGDDGESCPVGQFCSVPDGQCGDEGTCADSPSACPAITDPVCGCDDRTYSNSCFADVAGVSVAHEGICATPTVCGGAAGDSCGTDRFCKRPEGQCSADAQGVCVAKPPTCLTVLNPVCGCDGEDYDSACLAYAAGVNVEHAGVCETERACGGTAGDTCDNDEFCKLPEGVCSEDAEGVCAPQSEICPPNLDPVCGCDGTTYDNACVADGAGVSVDHAGACDDGTRACGGASGGTCGPLQYCQRPNGTCGQNAEGICRHRPVFCPPVVDPVCGCDGETYDNGCQAAFVGVSVNHPGACSSGSQVCGGTSGGTCGTDQYCKRPDGQCAETTEGVCTDIPGACQTIGDPVCGCNGATYDNACSAASAGVSVDHAGACETSTDVCGGDSGGTCGPLQFCKRPDGACSEAAEGVCRHRPIFCPPIVDPVCGCDGETYDNGCQAAFAGVDINHTGACSTTEPQACGGTTGGTCGENQYCKRPDGQCAETTEGVCADMPGFCSTILDPVCGCNATTYANACQAAGAGVSVDHAGACDDGTQVCGGTSGGTCGPLEFCKQPDGACSEAAEGVCRRRPLFCPPVLDPVCGCDGETYDNGCQAAFIGVSVNHTGACSTTEPQACGGTTGGVCGENQYCKRPDGQCAESTEGVCTDKPGPCQTNVNPVCGCDGVTYPNACAAASAGVSVNNAGTCEGGTQACGGTSGGVCGEDQYCKRPDGQCAETTEGVCTDIPGTCQTIGDPVCGCNGATYDNACSAASAGVSVDHTGACETSTDVCGGDSGGTCGPLQFCKRPDGACSEAAEGVCRHRPIFCPPVLDPVCGCDGETYDNGCQAAFAGVDINHTGACSTTEPQACGGTTGGTCGENQYCKRPDGQCAETTEGVCADKPGFCSTILDPVCGCNATTYANACQAAGAGVSVNHAGECTGGTQVCGGTSGGVCGEDQYCKRPDGQCAETTEGVCTDIPGTCQTIGDPVCGCNGATYDNACSAASAGVSVDHTGACETSTDVCGGDSGGTCGPLQFCKRPDGACSEAAEGVCRHRPIFCPPVLDPVCGCDGETYDNGCQAAFAGVDINHTGACSTTEPQACGGTTGGTCGENQYCKRPDGQCAETTEGVCADKPGFCSTILDPVCGCNATTYANACQAAGAGVSVNHAGECTGGTQVCGGTTGGTCPTDQYCKRPDGQCAETTEGVCTEIPASCEPTGDPVCGCNGTTYDNACAAGEAGVTVDHTGACETSTQVCGGDSGGTCGPLQFCKRPDGACSEAAEGVCRHRPIFCPPIVDPVCGCDGETYDNGCQAAFAGVDINHTGACSTTEPQACGGTTGGTCGENQYCKRPDGQCAETTEGVCADKPGFCSTILDPVCGCNATTYANACQAAGAGVSVNHAGECTGGTQVCGGTTGGTCPTDQYCKRPDGQCAETTEGVCTEIPASCEPTGDPVCGCNGTTYDNACAAGEAGVTVDHTGACETSTQVCGGDSGGTCGPLQFCKRPDGACSEAAEGVCRHRPIFCPPIVDPVCGCDGETYDNGCQAAFAGVDINHTGACSTTEPQACGGTTGGTCGENQYCKRPDGQCAETTEGVCADKPGFCSTILDPVCGCNATTYANACQAAGAGVSVNHAGECTGGTQVCGGTTGGTCPTDQYCKRPDGQCAETTEGVCTEIPASCESTGDPVCGCNGTTYDNACAAGEAGVTVDHTGACETSTQVCGGDSGGTCGPLQFCKRPDGACSEAAEGVCRHRPIFCPPIVDPVCGCDGETYDNGCQAAFAGVDINHTGACSTTEPQACGGTTGGTCGENQYCKRPDGQCAESTEGVCADMPGTCQTNTDPVCGCDATTYANACQAAGAGVSVDHAGACESGTEVCGGTSGGTCSPLQYCKQPDGACSESTEGVCRHRPIFCPPLVDPVCGCDGETYDNGCQAAFIGVSVNHTGACSTTEPQACGGTGGGTCGENQYCKRPDGQCAESTAGVCTDKPGPCQTNVNPVCGCDGVTYPNACAAASAGVSVNNAGTCDGGTDTQVCGGTSGGICGKDQYCKRPDGQCSESTEGVCTDISGTCCPPDGDPVCGCNATTYANACAAAAAGVSVDHAGECETSTQVCGGTSGGTCGPLQFCKRPDGACSEAAEGVCRHRPIFCPPIVDPVCGCDGETYDNGCQAAFAGVDVNHTGACSTTEPQACGGTTGGTCGENQYCKRPDGQCSESTAGVCADMPGFCSTILDPVCGCNATTYANACQAAGAGVSVDHAGECETGTQVCGGTSGGTCGPDQYCKLPTGQCSENTEGVCTDIPGACQTNANPVCGCDATTYLNACLAAGAGVSVDHTGACDDGTQVCGGKSGGTCGTLDYCKRSNGECSEAAEGVCKRRPLFCAPLLDPVCGCDGETYDNGCQAAFIGVSVNHTGACSTTEPQACGGASGGTCGANQYCKRPDGQCSESTQGVCTDKPGPCQTNVNPVCGCNGTTYDNACAAASAGVSVDHAGTCGGDTSQTGVKACGGSSGDSCGSDQYCSLAVGLCSASVTGVCVDKPAACPTTRDPVCGCDGVTYRNACQAAARGIGVSHSDACGRPQGGSGRRVRN